MNRRRAFPRKGIAILLAIGLSLAIAASASATLSRLVAGPRPNGTGVTPQGWLVTPAGRQTDLGPGPLAVAASPRGNLVLVADARLHQHALLAIDPATGSVIQTIKAPGGNSSGPWDLSWGHPTATTSGWRSPPTAPAPGPPTARATRCTRSRSRGRRSPKDTRSSCRRTTGTRIRTRPGSP